jgi:hypothetical protein
MTATEFLRNNPWLDERTLVNVEFELREVLDAADIDNKDRQKLRQQIRQAIGEFRSWTRAANYVRALERNDG